MRALMRGVVEEGTGTNAAIPGAIVGGKTGTAQHGIGNSGTPYAWFVSWAQGARDLEPKWWRTRRPTGATSPAAGWRHRSPGR
jgi:peptidoglycan glycosyltransferase